VILVDQKKKVPLRMQNLATKYKMKLTCKNFFFRKKIFFGQKKSSAKFHREVGGNFRIPNPASFAKNFFSPFSPISDFVTG
jgi:hypothetical protein